MPGTAADWPSDITLEVNGIEVGTWTSPGDFGDKRGVYTPDWWKLRGSQYGMLEDLADQRRRAPSSTACRSRTCTPDDLELDGPPLDPACGSACARMREHPGGINIFGRGFGNYDQDIVLRLVDLSASAKCP